MIEKKDHGVWNERYRADSLDGYVCEEQLKARLQHCIDNNDIPHFMFCGRPGTGKTTIAQILYKNLECDYLYINASDERGIDTVRNKITGFASTMSFKPLKIVVLDEVDFMMQGAQASLRNIIETYSRNTRFILTCNYRERVLDALQSRCEVYDLKPPSKKDVAVFLGELLDKENVKWEPETLAEVVNLKYPDIRNTINQSQRLSITGELVFDRSKLIDSEYMVAVVNHLKSPKKSTFNDIRQILADNTRDYEHAFTYLYSQLEFIDSSKIPMLTILLGKYQHMASMVPDKEINFCAMIAEMLQILEK